MAAEIHRIVSGRWKQNGYLIVNSAREALVIDPGGESQEFSALIDQQELMPLAILNTHGHFDHIGAVATLAERYGLPFYLHWGDRLLVEQANFYQKLFDGDAPIVIPAPTNDLSQLAEPLTLGGFVVECMFTPGHTKGGMCFKLSDALFSGDTLLPNGIGRSDLPGGGAADLQVSFTTLCGLSPILTIYPGHGRPFRLGDRLERFANAAREVH